MTAQIALSSEARLRAQVGRWERWRRLVQSAEMLPRLILAGLVVMIIVSVVSRLRPWLLPGEIVVMGGLLLVLVSVIGIAAIWVYPRPLLDSARRFDRALNLNERTTTALELMEGRIRTSDELLRRQLDDALSNAERARPNAALPLRINRRDWALVLFALVMAAALLILPNPQSGAVAQDNAEAASLEEAAAAVREIVRDVALNPGLDEQTREQLMQTLSSSLEVLEQPNVTPEEAFAALSDAGNTLRNQGETMSQQAQASQAGLEAAAQALRNAPTLDQEQRAQSLSDLLEQMGAEAGQFSEAERSQAADALEQAAQAAQSTDAQLAQEMRDAAQALQQGDPGQTQQQLSEAQQQAESSQANQQNAQEAAQQMQQSAQQAQQASQQMSQQQASQEGQQQSGQQGQQSQQGEQGQQGQSAQQGAPQQGDQQAQPGREGEQPSGQQGEQGAQGEASQDASGSQTEGNPSANAQQEGQSSSGAASAGDSSAGSIVQGAQAGQIENATNNPDGAGQTPYEQIYAPTRLGDSGDGTEIQLESDTSGMPVQEGDFAENPTGQASVPYNEVFGTYSDAANRALESDYVPLGLRDLVRNYFTGLEPGR